MVQFAELKEGKALNLNATAVDKFYRLLCCDKS